MTDDPPDPNALYVDAVAELLTAAIALSDRTLALVSGRPTGTERLDAVIAATVRVMNELAPADARRAEWNLRYAGHVLNEASMVLQELADQD